MALRPVVEECVRLLRTTLAPALILECTFDEQAPEVLADRSQILQLLINLTTNAVHAIESQGGRIDISVESVDIGKESETARSELKSGRYARISIHDTGIGMTAKTVERICEPFFTTKGSRQGTGLGLSVAHGIVQSHGGSISVQSSSGEGSRSDVFLPGLRRPI